MQKDKAKINHLSKCFTLAVVFSCCHIYWQYKLINYRTQCANWELSCLPAWSITFLIRLHAAYAQCAVRKDNACSVIRCSSRLLGLTSLTMSGSVATALQLFSSLPFAARFPPAQLSKHSLIICPHWSSRLQLIQELSMRQKVIVFAYYIIAPATHKKVKQNKVK